MEKGCKNCRVSIGSANFPCRSLAISSPRSLYGQNICSALNAKSTAKLQIGAHWKVVFFGSEDICSAIKSGFITQKLTSDNWVEKMENSPIYHIWDFYFKCASCQLIYVLSAWMFWVCCFNLPIFASSTTT